MAPSEKAPPKRPPPKPQARLSPNEKLGVVSATFLFFAVIYRLWLFDIVNVVLAFNRTVQPIEDFPYDCKRIVHPLLEACEDLWLDHSGRKLYASCSDTTTRAYWNPGGSVFNHTGRSGADHISVLDIDNPGTDGLFGVRQLEISKSFSGTLDLLNLEAREIDGHLRFWLVNHRPPVNTTTGEVLPVGNAIGANSTIEIFDLSKVSGKLEHVKTISSKAIVSPNSIAASKDGLDFFFTNDHTHKVGIRRDLEMFTGGGTVGHCRSDTGVCRLVSKGLFNFPNGIARGKDDLYYVGNSIKGLITVFKYEDGKFVDIDQVYPKISFDNLSVDADGNIIATALPFVFQSLKSIHNPHGPTAPATVLKVERIESTDPENKRPKYEVTKLIEDKESKFLPTATTTVHDVKTQRLFLSGVNSRFMTVCQKRL
jgi:hypothetical protein